MRACVHVRARARIYIYIQVIHLLLMDLRPRAAHTQRRQQDVVVLPEIRSLKMQDEGFGLLTLESEPQRTRSVLSTVINTRHRQQ